MYDLEILVPAEMGSPKIAARLSDFKELGLLNIAPHKIKVVLACSPNEANHRLETGWPEGVDVEIFKTPYFHVSQRIAHYYHSYIKAGTARWYMRIDEDSVTDINRLLYNMDRMFDHKKIYHVVAELNYDVNASDEMLLNSLGFEWWRDTGRLTHEYEVSITSNAAIKTIFEQELAKQYLSMRQELPEGPGDHSLTYCARMSKVYPIVGEFITRHAELNRLSIFGGHRNHIHEICHDRCQNSINWLRLYLQNPERNDKFKDKICLLTINNRSDWNARMIRLLPSGYIKVINDDSPGLWSTTENGLNIYIHHNTQLFFDKLSPAKDSAECEKGHLKFMLKP